MGACPDCSEKVYETAKAYFCPDCTCDDATPFKRFSRIVLGKAIPRDQFQRLLNGGETDLIEGFRSNKTGRYFSAKLAIRNNKLSFEFESRPAKKSKKS